MRRCCLLAALMMIAFPGVLLAGDEDAAPEGEETEPTGDAEEPGDEAAPGDEVDAEGAEGESAVEVEGDHEVEVEGDHEVESDHEVEVEVEVEAAVEVVRVEEVERHEVSAPISKPAPAPKGKSKGHHGKHPWPAIPEAPLTIDVGNDFALTFVGRVQVRATLFDMDDPDRNDPVVYGDPNLREGVSIRRARIGLEGQWRDLLGFRVVGAWDNRYDALAPASRSGFLLKDAWFSVTPAEAFGVVAGLTRVPFGRQPSASSGSLLMIDRSVVAEHMGPGNEPGFAISGALGPKPQEARGAFAPEVGRKTFPRRAFKYAVGIFNGGGDWRGDADASPRLVGRASLDMFSEWDDAESGWELPGLGLSFGGSAFYNWGLEANTFSAGGDVGVRLWQISIQAEILYASATPTFDTEGIPELLAQRDSLGWYTQLGVQIIPQHLEVAIRVDAYDDNRGLLDAGDVLGFGGGVNFAMFGNRLRGQLHYVHRAERADGYQTKNDSLILQMQGQL